MTFASRIALALAGAAFGGSIAAADTVTAHRLPAALAVEAASETVSFCARQGYRETAAHGLRHLGVLERVNEFIVAARQADLLEVVVRGVKVNAVLLNQHGHSVARHLADQQGENLLLVQRLLSAPALGRFGRAQRRKK